MALSSKSVCLFGLTPVSLIPLHLITTGAYKDFQKVSDKCCFFLYVPSLDAAMPPSKKRVSQMRRKCC